MAGRPARATHRRGAPAPPRVDQRATGRRHQRHEGDMSSNRRVDMETRSARDAFTALGAERCPREDEEETTMSESAIDRPDEELEPSATDDDVDPETDIDDDD